MLDLPEPLRPATTVSPGIGSSVSVTGDPMPRKPVTPMERRKAPVAGSPGSASGDSDERTRAEAPLCR